MVFWLERHRCFSWEHVPPPAPLTKPCPSLPQLLLGAGWLAHNVTSTPLYHRGLCTALRASVKMIGVLGFLLERAETKNFDVMSLFASNAGGAYRYQATTPPQPRGLVYRCACIAVHVAYLPRALERPQGPAEGRILSFRRGPDTSPTPPFPRLSFPCPDLAHPMRCDFSGGGVVTIARQLAAGDVCPRHM